MCVFDCKSLCLMTIMKCASITTKKHIKYCNFYVLIREALKV